MRRANEVVIAMLHLHRVPLGLMGSLLAKKKRKIESFLSIDKSRKRILETKILALDDITLKVL